MTLFVIGAIVLAIIWWLYRSSQAGNLETANPETDSMRSVADSVPARFVVFDFETTGLSPDLHEIIEIGAIRVNRDEDRHDTFQTFIRSLEPVPSKIVELTGISDDMLTLDGISLTKALQDFAAFVGDLPLVAFNAKFDKSFLRQASLKTGIPFNNKVSCALEAARRAWPNRNSYKLVDLSRDGGLKIDDSHRALGDCHRALIVYVAACRAV